MGYTCDEQAERSAACAFVLLLQFICLSSRAFVTLIVTVCLHAL